MSIRTSQPALDTLVIARDEVSRLDESIVMVTVVEAIGSNPQVVGARMLCLPDGSIRGTVGGGKIEAHIKKEANALLASLQTHKLQSVNLQEIGMTCGGKMTFFLEQLAPAPHLLIFGGGHIAAPTARLAAQTGFRVTVIDERTEWANPNRFPEATVVNEPFPSFLASYTPQAHHYLVMVSQGHAYDKIVLSHVLGGAQAYTGAIGSKQKAHKLKKELLQEGCTEAQWNTVHCPMGLPIGGDTAEEIAVSIVAQLIQTRHTNDNQKGGK